MVSTRNSSATKVHILSAFVDDEHSTALTALVNDVRFHIIVDTKDLDSGRESEEYKRMAHAVREKSITTESTSRNIVEKHQTKEEEGNEDKDTRQEDGQQWCTCSNPPPDTQMIACDGKACSIEWFHLSCVGLNSVPEGTWFCSSCKSASRPETPLRSLSPDSGVDVSNTPEKEASSLQIILPGIEDEEEEKRLYTYILTPFTSILTTYAPKHQSSDPQTLEEWYNPPTYFFTLKPSGSHLSPVELEPTDELATTMKELTPMLHLPKYLLNLDIPVYNATDLTVLSTSSSLGPLRPCRVSVKGLETPCFIKMVDMTQPGPTKREIKILHKIKKLELGKQFHVPKILGLVRSSSSSHGTIMGFLQTEIKDATPLTSMIDTDIPQSKREKWAKEAQRIVGVLHDHDLVFGDCKADNFLVDEEDKLWIIDFGGSYTEGWVDAEVAETVEGDEMGVSKIVGALEDPEGATFDVDDEGERKEEGREEQTERKQQEGVSERTEEDDSDQYDESAEEDEDSDEYIEDDKELTLDGQTPSAKHAKEDVSTPPTKPFPQAGPKKRKRAPTTSRHNSPTPPRATKAQKTG